MTAYAGIGSRSTPPDILRLMTKAALHLDDRGGVLRSGGAAGADSAFELGVYSKRKEIFLPWRLFNRNPSPLWPPSQRAMDLAAHFHPAWDRCSNAARSFHARNSHQVLGVNLDDPVKFVLCWTPGGEDVGGTAQALRLARAYGIYVLNLGAPDGPQVLGGWLGVK